MNVRFLEPAQAEFTEAVDYYNAQSHGLGLEFSDEVKATIGSYLVMQRGKDVYLCYMLDTRSDCTPAE